MNQKRYFTTKTSMSRLFFRSEVRSYNRLGYDDHVRKFCKQPEAFLLSQVIVLVLDV